jgi:hypothetical protein
MYSFSQQSGEHAANQNQPYNPYGQPQPQLSVNNKERSPSISSSAHKIRRRSRNSDSFSSGDYHNPPATSRKEEKAKTKGNIKTEPVDQLDDSKLKNGLGGLDQQKNNKGLLSSVFGIFSRQTNGPKSMILPPDKEKKVF